MNRRAQTLDAAAMRGLDWRDNELERTAVGALLQRPMTAARIPEAGSRETARPWRYRYGTTVVRNGSHIAMSGKTTSRPSNTNSRRWNGTVPITTSLNLPVQML
jgi:hypothetical protein